MKIVFWVYDFGLSTPHGALGTLRVGQSSRPLPFLSFNSTRCIRNTQSFIFSLTSAGLSTPHGALGTRFQRIPRSLGTFLSTPHGALGTGRKARGGRRDMRTFNSTRCIRNSLFYTHDLREKGAFNSTRCIRNQFGFCLCWRGALLSTPHGALGTNHKPASTLCFSLPFNSTRCIRNAG